jgi:hypothetical protein
VAAATPAASTVAPMHVGSRRFFIVLPLLSMRAQSLRQQR